MHIRNSASVVLTTSLDSDRVFLGLRHLGHRAYPGTYVFPGGKIDAADAEVPVLEAVDGVPDLAYVAAARELFEEAGVLVASPRDGRPLDLAELPRLREDLLAGRRDFSAILAHLNAEIDGRSLLPLGVKTTPPFHPVRFRNRFFMAVLPEGQSATVLPGELERGDWFRAADAVEQFHAGEILIAPPILMMLEAWGTRSARQALEELERFDDATFEGRPLRIRFSPQVILVPGRAPTLPPATHTNTYVLGKDRLLVVDPATTDPDDQKLLGMLLDELIEEGARIEAVVLTHHHPDHILATSFVQERTGAHLWTHAETTPLLPEDLRVDRELADGEVVDLGEGGEVEFLHTPGHAPGHLCLFQRRFGGLLVGDMVSTASTIVIDPPEGDLSLYLNSLRRLRALPARQLYPGHGDPVACVGRVIDHLLEHRRDRLERTREALDVTPRSLEELVPIVYADTPEELWFFATRSLLASLLLLEREKAAVRVGEGSWMAA